MHLPVLLIAVYLVLCMLVGLLGRHRKLGPWAYFFASIILTPIIGLLLLAASDPKMPRR